MVGPGVEPDVAVANIPVDTGVSACVKTQTDFSLQALILNSAKRGFAIDATWRNTNENRAALTLVVAVDHEFHLIPGKRLRFYCTAGTDQPLASALLSAKTDEYTITTFLEHLKVEIVQHATELVEGKSSVTYLVTL